MSVHIGVDIGGTKTDAVVTDANGVVAHRCQIPTEQGAERVVEVAKRAVGQVCAAAAIDPAAAASIGVGIPGTVEGGVVHHALNLGIAELDLATALAVSWGQRPVVDNDVNAAAVGAWMLAGEDRRSLAYLNLGTGLAAGIVLDGVVWRGSRGAAGEIGHVSVDPDGPVDGDGLRGGLETYASGSGIARQAGGADAAEVLSDADGNAEYAAIRDRLHFGVANAVRVLVLTLDVEEVVIAGGLTKAGDSLVDGARAHIARWEARSALFRSVNLGERMRVLDTTEPVAAIGAAMRGAGRG